MATHSTNETGTGKGMFRDQNGNKSSKRVVGFVLTAISSLFLLTLGVIAVVHKIADPATALDAGKTTLIAGVGLIGSSVVEFLGGKR